MPHYDYAETYSKRSDDELRRIEADKESLVEEAKQALERELQKRQISGDDDQPEAFDPTEVSKAAPVKTGASWWERLLVFLAWDVVAFFFVILVLGSRLKTGAAETLGGMFVYFPLAGWGMTGIVPRHWLTIKRTLIIATIMYAIALAWLTIEVLQ